MTKMIKSRATNMYEPIRASFTSPIRQKIVTQKPFDNFGDFIPNKKHITSSRFTNTNGYVNGLRGDA